MKPSLTQILSAAFFASLAACSNSSGGGISLVPIMETEPNDSMATAGSLRVGQNVEGDLVTTGDTDWWQVSLNAGDVLSIEVFARRFDQTGWDTDGNAAVVNLYDTDGTTMILTQSESDFDWGFNQDTDVLAWRVPTSGTYFVEVTTETPANAGGNYLASIHKVTLDGTQQFETEAMGVSGDNDDFMTAEAIVPGVMHGWRVDNEADFFSFDVTEASIVRFTMSAHRDGIQAGDVLIDPVLVLYDPSQNTLYGNDDVFYLDSSIQYVIETPGTYYIEVNECCGEGDGPYQLAFELTPASDLNVIEETEPNNDLMSAEPIAFGDVVTGDYDGGVDYFSFACNAGDRIHVEYIPREGELFEPSIVILDSMDVGIVQQADGTFGASRSILTSTGTYYAVVGGSLRGGPPTPYAFRVTQIPASYETEPNDVITDATTLNADGIGAGEITTDGDADVFSFTGKKDIPVVLDVFASSTSAVNGFFLLDGFGSGMQPLLVVRDADDNVLATWDSLNSYLTGVIDGQPTATIAFVPPANGTYFLELSDSAGNFGAGNFYVVSKRQ